MATLPPTHAQLLRGGKPPRDRDADRRYDERRRDDPARKVRSSERWHRVRALALARDRHLCLDCLAEGRPVRATQVDHVKPVRERPDLAFALSNLRSLCTAHHARKSREERRGA